AAASEQCRCVRIASDRHVARRLPRGINHDWVSHVEPRPIDGELASTRTRIDDGPPPGRPRIVVARTPRKRETRFVSLADPIDDEWRPDAQTWRARGIEKLHDVCDEPRSGNARDVDDVPELLAFGPVVHYDVILVAIRASTMQECRAATERRWVND